MAHLSTQLRRLARSACACLVAGCLTVSVAGADDFVVKQGDREVRFSGKLLVEAQDGGIIALAPDGRIWPVKPAELVKRTPTEEAFTPLDAAALTAQLKQELPQGFRVHETKHYLICYNTTEAYAEWCGALFERLYGAFTNYWNERGFELSEPQFPMVAVVFSDKAGFAEHGRAELGDAIDSIIGYYSFRSNQMTMYDLTGVAALRRPGDKGKASDINAVLSQPQAERTVATIIHEATHQIAHNCGLQQRYASNPLWVSEGLAVFFETPDLSSRKGWRNIGAINRYQFQQFQKYASRRPAGALATLIADDKPFRDARLSADAYAEAWAVTYYLMKARPKQYHEYLKLLSKKGVAEWDTPETRMAEFKQAFGELAGFEEDYLRFMRRQR